MNTSVAKKASRAVRLLMMVLTAVLIFFFINVMLLVSDIQGTARVVNYAGLVRGTTQRIVKLEDARIFCREFQAELVAVAGHYKVLEDIPKDLRGKAVQVWLENGQIKLAALD